MDFELENRIKKDFTGHSNTVIRQVKELALDVKSPDLRLRIRWSAILLAKGSISSFENLCSITKSDWREVLGLGEQFIAKPEKYRIMPNPHRSLERYYSAWSFEEKVKYWSDRLHYQMCWQEESELNPYAIYTLAWFRKLEKQDPDIYQIMDEVFDNKSGLGVNWSREEVFSRIQRKE